MSGKHVWRDPRACSVLGLGFALPGEPVTNDDLLIRMREQFGVDIERAGRMVAAKLAVTSRHICRNFLERREPPRRGDDNAHLAARAVSAALEEAAINVADLSFLIGHTCSPNQAVPPNIAEVADLLGFAGPYLELRQACTGFANALITARGLLSAPGCGPVAIVGSECGSLFFDPARAGADHGQLVNLMQMGDAAAACIVASGVHGGKGTLSHVYFGQEGAGRMPGFALDARGAEYQHDFVAVRASGAELFKRGLAAARSMSIEPQHVERIIPHQVSGHIGEQLASHFGLPTDQFFVNADKVGNTGSAAIWLALAQLRPQLSRGHRVLVLGAEATKYMYGGFLYVHG